MEALFGLCSKPFCHNERLTSQFPCSYDFLASSIICERAGVSPVVAVGVFTASASIETAGEGSPIFWMRCLNKRVADPTTTKSKAKIRVLLLIFFGGDCTNPPLPRKRPSFPVLTEPLP